MASAYLKQFAIDNSLTVDYGYTYGKYKNFYISIKESIGTSKTLNIITKLASNKEALKSVLAVYGEELPKYCVSDVKREENYLQFTFNLPNDKTELVIEFLDKFIESYIANGLEIATICPICSKKILDSEKVAIVDISGILTPTHDECFNKGKEKVKETVEKKQKEINKDRKGYGMGLLGALTFSLIYAVILIGAFFIVQFLLNNINSNSEYPFSDSAMGSTIFQYSPVLIALAASPLINSGYETFKGKKGTGKFLIILPIVIVITLLATFFGFILSLLLVTSDYGFENVFKLVLNLLTPSTGALTFRRAFYIYIIVGLALSLVSLLFTFGSKKEQEEADATTFEKLD